jgi:hypothetical protein
MSSESCETVGAGAIRFYDNYVPALDVGDYLVDVSQRVNPASTTVDDRFEATQAFSVAGPRWNLPAADVFCVYPPNEAVGQFDQDLPHVVFTVRELPWERNVFVEEDKAERTPWLALLALDPDDLLVSDPDKANRTRSISIPVSLLFDPAGRDGSTLWPSVSTEWYEAAAAASDSCNVVDLAPATFTTLIPSRHSLRYFAHARQVDVSAKDAGVLEVSRNGWYSVAIANRQPAASSGEPLRTIVHLVSLEGLAQCVDDPSKLAAYEKVRLVSLHSWTFTCVAETGETFAELVRALPANGMSMSVPVGLPREGTTADVQARSMLARGYVALPWRTRLGEQSWGWYRGPFAAEPVGDFVDPGQPSARDTGWRPYGTASSAIIYDPDSGVFDLSYAVAWETGRLLALADGAFSRALLDWQRRGHRLVDLIAERMSQSKALSSLSIDDEPTEEQILALVKKYAVTDDFMKALVDDLAGQLAPRLTAPSAEPPDAPFPPYADMPAPVPDPQTLADLMTDRGIQEAIRTVGGRQLGTIADWLAQRYALMGVPFEALVPNASLLPPESIRCFYVDVNWINFLLEGALSIGIESSRDAVYQDLMKDLIWDATLIAAGSLRAQLLDGELRSPGGEPEAMAGVLLRSAVVSGWPGLELRAFERIGQDGNPDATTEIKLLRMERLSDGVVLSLWPQVPGVVTVDEPREGIAFGFQDPPPGESGRLWLDLRSLNTTDYGMRLGTWVDVSAAVGASRVIDLDALLTAIEPHVGQALAVRDFATEMLRTPERAIFASA